MDRRRPPDRRRAAQLARFTWLLMDPGDIGLLNEQLERLERRGVDMQRLYALLVWAKLSDGLSKGVGPVVRSARVWLRDRELFRHRIRAIVEGGQRLYGALTFKLDLKDVLWRQLQRKENNTVVVVDLRPGAERVLHALDELRAAVAEDPLMQVTRRPRARGNQPAPWKRAARRELRGLCVPRERGEALLRLLGVHTSRS